MRFDALRLRGISAAFPGEVEIDLRHITGLCAVVGGNGAGKSTLLGCFTGAAHRQMPDGQRLSALATGRDSYVEASYTNGQSFTIRQTIDAQTGKGEAVVLDAEGRPLVESGKVSEAKRWVSEHMPPADVLYSSIFGAQGSAGFIDLDPAPRKSVLMSVLGHEHLEAKARLAAERAKAEAVALDTCVARLADERQRGGDVEQLHRELATATEALTVSTNDLERAEKALVEARAQHERRLAEERAQHAAIDRQLQLGGQLAKLDADLALVAARRANNTALLEQASEIRAAVARVAEIEREIAALEERGKLAARLRRLDVDLAKIGDRRRQNAAVLEQAVEIRAAVTRKAELETIVAELRSQGQAAQAAVATAERDLAIAKQDAAGKAAEVDRLAREGIRIAGQAAALRPAVEAAEAALPGLEEARKAAADLATSVADQLGLAEGKQLAGKSGRIETLREWLSRVMVEDDPALAGPALAEDDATAVELAGLPVRIEALKRDLEEARQARQRAEDAAYKTRTQATERKHLDELEAMDAANSRAIAAADAVRDAAELEVAGAELALKRAQEVARDLAAELAPLEAERQAVIPVANQLERLKASEARLEELDGEAARVGEDRAALQAEHDAIAAPAGDAATLEAERVELLSSGVAEKAARLQTCEARLQELAEQAARLNTERAAVVAEHTSIVVPTVTTPSVSVMGFEDGLRAEQGRFRLDQLAHARAEDAHGRAVASATRIAELEAERRQHETDLADWRLLEQGLGRNGLQALELDAASPEMTELANDLLSACFGSRFSLRFETTAAKKSGKGDKEGFWIWVHDNECTGPEREAKHHSGGEKVWIGEAVDLALAMLGCRHGGMTNPSIVRDERGAALAAENGPRYVAMLRRAAELVNAAHVLFVTHDPALQELADSVIHVGGGKAEVRA